MAASRSPSLEDCLEGAALMGGDMIGLVAFDLVLRIIFRRVTHMALIVKIFRMDGDNDARHSAGLGIPAYMIANLEPFSHLANSLFLPQAPLNAVASLCSSCELYTKLTAGVLSRSADAIVP